MFNSGGLPIGFSPAWNPALLRLSALSDSLIALAYFLIPALLVRIVRGRRDVPFNNLFFSFATFILACGATHVMEVVALWRPVYWAIGALKGVTAIISITTLGLLARQVPAILAMPSHADMDEANDQTTSVLENTTVCAMAMDSNWNIHYMNRNARALLSVGRDIQGTTLWDAFPAQLPEERATLIKVMEDRKPVMYESFYAPLDLTTTVQAHPWANGGVAVFFSDISAQRRLERELEVANRRAESVLENTNIGIFAVDRDWIFRYVNGDAKKLLKATDLLGKDMWASFPGMTAETTQRIRQVMSTRTPAGFDSYYAPLDLSTHLSVNPWEDEEGITVCFSDISDQKRMQRELDWERVMREQRLVVLARFSAGIAHEIKNPMAIIHARASDLAEMAADGEILSADVVTTACESIVKTSDRAMRILRGLAALAREGSNEPMQEANPGAMVEQAIELVHGRYRNHGIHLQSIVPARLPLVECREVQISQVLLNLLNNAFDAIDASPNSERWVRVEVSETRSEEGAERLQIDVVDGGPALSTEVREHLMEPFYTTKPLGGGIGMGLSVSRAIATSHGGTLELHDCDGHTCFRLLLPVRAALEEGVAA